MKNEFFCSEPADRFSKRKREKNKLVEYEESDRLKKLKALMLGHALGDALGVPVEFSSREELDENPVADMMGWGTHFVPEGCWSDDTAMSLATLDVLAKGCFNRNETMQNFASWLSRGEFTATGNTFDVGNTCQEAIRRFMASDSKDAEVWGLDGECNNGNGSLMRIHPLVAYATFTFLNGSERGYWLWMGCIKAGSELTHAHSRSVMGCYIYGYCLSFLLKEATRESLIAGIEFAGGDLDYLEEFECYKRIFEPNFEKLEREEIKSSGYVVDTLEAAIWCVLTTKDYKECVLKAVNLGGDTDTVAAIAGGLAGVLYGIDAIPKEWLSKLKRREYIEKMCEEAEKNWMHES